MGSDRRLDHAKSLRCLFGLLQCWQAARCLDRRGTRRGPTVKSKPPSGALSGSEPEKGYGMRIFLVLFLCLSGCVLDDAFAGGGGTVLGVEVPGTVVAGLDPAYPGMPRIGVLGPSFGWSAVAECGCDGILDRVCTDEFRESGAVVLQAEDGFQVAEIPISIGCGDLSGYPDAAWVVLSLSAGTVLQAAPMNIPDADRSFNLVGQGWSAAATLGILRCYRYEVATGSQLEEVPCLDGLGGVLAPISSRGAPGNS